MNTVELHRDQRGMTLVEVIISLLVYGVVVSAAGTEWAGRPPRTRTWYPLLKREMLCLMS